MEKRQDLTPPRAKRTPPSPSSAKSFPPESSKDKVLFFWLTGVCGVSCELFVNHLPSPPLSVGCRVLSVVRAKSTTTSG